MNASLLSKQSFPNSQQQQLLNEQLTLNPMLRVQRDQIYQQISSPSYYISQQQSLQNHQDQKVPIVANMNQALNISPKNLSASSQLTQQATHHTMTEKISQTEPKSTNYELLAAQQRRNQIRQFTLGNEFEQTANFIQISNRQSISNTLGSQDQYLGSANNINNLSNSHNFANFQRGSLTSLINVNGENDQLKQIISDLQQRLSRLEERVESSEEKIELNERLFKLRDSQYESAQLAQVGASIKLDVEKYVESVIIQQQQECDRTIEVMKKIDIFEKRLKNNEESYIKFSTEIDNQFKEQLLQQNSLIDRAMKLTNSNSTQIEKGFEKNEEFNTKFQEISEKVKLLQQNITLNKDETLENLKHYEQSLELLTQVQNNITEDLKQNIRPSIKGLEDDFLRMLQNYKEISDSVHIMKFLEEEMILVKHKIKIILQKVNINENTQVSNSSLIKRNTNMY